MVSGNTGMAGGEEGNVSATGSDWPSESRQTEQASLAALAAILAATTMLFSAFVSAYVVRRGISADWAPLRIPAALDVSVLPGLAVSIVLEIFQRSAGRASPGKGTTILSGAAILGFASGAMHVFTWRQFRSDGVTLTTNSAAAFFFVLDGAFVIFLAGGVVSIALKAWTISRDSAGSAARIAGLRYYWLYLNLLWIFLLGFLHVWK